MDGHQGFRSGTAHELDAEILAQGLRGPVSGLGRRGQAAGGRPPEKLTRCPVK